MKIDTTHLKNKLDPIQYDVCVNRATEPPFSGKYHDCKEKGTYTCICCGDVLFDSETKFDSGTGWPSFYQPVNDQKIDYIDDTTYGMVRTEVACKKCGSHLGHVFDDGPQPTRLRFCINSASLKLFTKKPS